MSLRAVTARQTRQHDPSLEKPKTRESQLQDGRRQMLRWETIGVQGAESSSSQEPGRVLEEAASPIWRVKINEISGSSASVLA